MTPPQLIEGGFTVDDRGEVGFVNNFNFTGVKRFYWIINHKSGLVRAWHAHRREMKYFLVVQGAALVGAVQIDDWEDPSKDQKVWRYVLTDSKPSILQVPPGYANGLMSLTEDMKIIVFSTSTLEEGQNDDIRYPARHWDIWTVQER